MNRGKRKIDDLLKKIGGNATTESVDSKMVESKPQFAQKCEAICYRYYFYTRIHRLLYPEMMELLMADFFISAGRIADILAENEAIIKGICKDSLTINQLQIKYPNYSWPIPVKKEIKPKERIFYNLK